MMAAISFTYEELKLNESKTSYITLQQSCPLEALFSHIFANNRRLVICCVSFADGIPKIDKELVAIMFENVKLSFFLELRGELADSYIKIKSDTEFESVENIEKLYYEIREFLKTRGYNTSGFSDFLLDHMGAPPECQELSKSFPTDAKGRFDAILFIVPQIIFDQLQNEDNRWLLPEQVRLIIKITGITRDENPELAKDDKYYNRQIDRIVNVFSERTSEEDAHMRFDDNVDYIKSSGLKQKEVEIEAKDSFYDKPDNERT